MVFKWFILCTCRLKQDHDRFESKVFPFIFDSMKHSSFDFNFNYLYRRSHQELSLHDNKYEIVSFRKKGNKYQFKKSERNKDNFNVLEWIEEIFTQSSNGVIISGHSNGITFEHSSLDIVQINKIFGKRKREIIIFDTCYCGSIETLYEVSNNFKFSIATPSYYVGRSLLEMTTFYIENDDLIYWMRTICNELISKDRSYSRVEYPIEIVIYDLKELSILVDYIEENNLWKKLKYNNSCLSISREYDDNLYSLECIIEKSFSGKVLEKFSKLLKKTIINCIYHGLQDYPLTLLGIRLQSLPDYEDPDITCQLKLFKKLCIYDK